MVHCSVFMNSVLPKFLLTDECFGTLYTLVVKLKNSCVVHLGLLSVLCVFMDNQMRLDQTGPTEAKENQS